MRTAHGTDLHGAVPSVTDALTSAARPSGTCPARFTCHGFAWRPHRCRRDARLLSPQDEDSYGCALRVGAARDGHAEAAWGWGGAPLGPTRAVPAQRRGAGLPERASRSKALGE